jgi:hypothetical protein
LKIDFVDLINTKVLIKDGTMTIRKFQEWDPEAKEIKQEDDTIKYEGDWITPKLLSKEEAWSKFKLLHNAKTLSKKENRPGKYEELYRRRKTILV